MKTKEMNQKKRRRYTLADMERAWDQGLRYGLAPHKNANPFSHAKSNPYRTEPSEAGK